MARQKLTDEERAQRREAINERNRAKRAAEAEVREQEKRIIRGEITSLASVIPPPCSRWIRRRCMRMENRAR